MLGNIEVGGRRRRTYEMVGWHHRLDGHEFEQALGVGDRQGSWRAAVHGAAKSWTRLIEQHQLYELSLSCWHSRSVIESDFK